MGFNGETWLVMELPIASSWEGYQIEDIYDVSPPLYEVQQIGGVVHLARECSELYSDTDADAGQVYHSDHDWYAENSNEIQGLLPYEVQRARDMGVAYDPSAYQAVQLHTAYYLPTQAACRYVVVPIPNSPLTLVKKKRRSTSQTSQLRDKAKQQEAIVKCRYCSTLPKKEERVHHRNQPSIPKIPNSQTSKAPKSSHSRTSLPSTSPFLTGQSTIGSSKKEKRYSRSHSTASRSSQKHRTCTIHEADSRSIGSIESDTTKLGIIPSDKVAVPYDMSSLRSCKSRDGGKKKRGFFT